MCHLHISQCPRLKAKVVNTEIHDDLAMMIIYFHDTFLSLAIISARNQRQIVILFLAQNTHRRFERHYAATFSRYKYKLQVQLSSSSSQDRLPSQLDTNFDSLYLSIAINDLKKLKMRPHFFTLLILSATPMAFADISTSDLRVCLLALYIPSLTNHGVAAIRRRF